MDALPRLFGWLLGNSFSILAALAGIVVACLLWARAPRPALLLLIASLMNLLLIMCTAWYFMIYLPQQLELHDTSVAERAQFTAIINLALGLFHALAYGLLIGAVAIGRAQPRLPPDGPWR